MNEAVKEAIRTGKTALGIEFGSTRIKAVLVDESHAPIAMGTYDWENRLENNIWTYSLEDIWKGLQGCYKSLTDDVEAKYGEKLTTLGSLGFSGMMHGYMPFNAAGELLVPFRTWRNTQTSEACRKLIPVFNFNIPQRWSIAHLYQAILSGEDHVKDIAFFTTLAGYIHWKLSGERCWASVRQQVCSPLIPPLWILIRRCWISSMAYTILTGRSVTFCRRYW